MTLSSELHKALFSYYETLTNGPQVCLLAHVGQPNAGHPLKRQAVLATCAIIDGRRIIAKDQARDKRVDNAIICARVDEKLYYGEVLQLFRHQQPGAAAFELAHMRWMVPTTLPLDIWKE